MDPLEQVKNDLEKKIEIDQEKTKMKTAMNHSDDGKDFADGKAKGNEGESMTEVQNLTKFARDEDKSQDTEKIEAVQRKEGKSITSMREYLVTERAAGPAAKPEKLVHEGFQDSDLLDYSDMLNEMKPFGCSYCDASFVFPWELQQHASTHTPGKPFKCTICGEEFARRTQLHIHSNVKHTITKPFKCAICLECFARPGELRKHVKEHRRKRQALNVRCCFDCFSRMLNQPEN